MKEDTVLKKKWLLFFMSVILLFTMIPPETGQASELDKINQQLADLQEQMRSAEKKLQDAQDTIQTAEIGKKETKNELAVITSQIDTKVNEMARVSQEIDQAEVSLEDNARQLEEANERIATRSKMLDSRVQLMYMNGSVSYLDVLFSATSFSDFLSRLDSLELMASQDKNLLDEHKRDKQLVLEKKKEIETELVRVKQLYAQLDQTKQELMKKEKEKEVMIASFDTQIEEMHGLSAEQDKLLVEFAQSRSSLQQQQINEIEKERKKRQEEERKRKEAEAAAAGNSGSSGSSGSTGSSNFTGAFSDGTLAVPLKSSYVITSRFGIRTDPITGKKNVSHNGLDMAAPGGTSIYAAESGVVILAEWWSGYGNCVIIDHGGGLWTLYGHIRNGGIKVSKGDKVQVGDKIAEVGTTGNSTGNHLHFEVRLNGERVDPENYLN